MDGEERVNMANVNIPGLVMSGTVPQEPPTILVIGPEKSGKSTLAASLKGWPEAGKEPIVLAWDPSGPDSCSSIGLPVPMIKVRDQSGGTWFDKGMLAISNIQAAINQHGKDLPFGALVVDCASTMVERLHDDARKIKTSKDTRQQYGLIMEWSKEIMARIHDLGLPTIWLAWQKEPFTEETVKDNGQKVRRQIMGGPLITGNFRAKLAGTVHLIAVLEKVNVGPNGQGADPLGYARVLHTRTWAGMEAGGRYLLPEPFPGHLGYLLDAILKRGDFAPKATPTAA
jgi:hypothetical protein